jgi:hypothetical protein
MKISKKILSGGSNPSLKGAGFILIGLEKVRSPSGEQEDLKRMMRH